MKYTEITVHTTTLGSELVSDIFWQFTEDGVAISDVNDVIALSKAKRGTWDYIDEKLLAPAEVLCKGYVPADDERTKSAVLSALRRLKENAAVPVGTLETVQREVEGDAWIETWKEHFRPFNIGKVVVCPAWLDHAPKAGETTVKIDTFMAFGTGEHETTSMCVELLQEFMRPGETVIDVGCGSGILGITASLLGAEKVIMTDIDECAVTAAKNNAALNGIKNYTVELKNLLDDETCKGDIVLANIMAEILVGFSGNIGGNLNAGGTVILSGILNTKEDFVKNAYTSAGFKEIKALRKGEWVALAMKKAV